MVKKTYDCLEKEELVLNYKASWLFFNFPMYKVYPFPRDLFVFKNWKTSYKAQL